MSSHKLESYQLIKTKNPALTKCKGEETALPVLVVSEHVLFPNQILVLSKLEGFEIADLLSGKVKNLRVAVVTRIKAEEPSKLYPIGTEAIVTSVLRMPDGTVGVVLSGLRRVACKDIKADQTGLLTGNFFVIEEPALKKTTTLLASLRILKELIEKILKINKMIPQDVSAVVMSSQDPKIICDLITPFLSLDLADKLDLLGTVDLRSRIKKTLKNLSRELELLQISQRIHKEVTGDLQEGIRRTYLQEQMVAIKKELNDIDGETSDEFEDLQKEIEQFKAPEYVKEAARKEMSRLASMPYGSPEYLISWNYLELLKEMPWVLDKSKVEVIKSIQAARAILNKHHFGLEKVKERILEYIAVLKHKKTIRSQILVLQGPPGVGKTSLVKSIAEVLDRPFVKISLGGIRDEAEIRGHRRTYIGAMPGKIIQAVKQAKANNPVILLDEIDKVGASGAQGDVSAALLEVLDPEQNSQFVDHFLSLPFDLSNVIFIATANNLSDITAPLLDRMEVIELSGYSESEKLAIAKGYIVPALRTEYGLTKKQFDAADDIIRSIIRFYTREAGIRQLKRQFESIARKLVKKLVSKKPVAAIKSHDLVEYLGIPAYIEEPRDQILPLGVAVGLAYTYAGGDILYIEGKLLGDGNENKGSMGRLVLTGSLGKVMQESAQTVLSFLNASREELGIEKDKMQKDVHIHFPDGATPKDGPSAGVAILSALTSLYLDKPVPAHFAMTGEVTLRGQVLPVGGIKEKVLAAHRYKKTHIILPLANCVDLAEVPKEVLNDLKIFPVKDMQDVLYVLGLLKPKKQLKPAVFRKAMITKQLPFLKESGLNL